LIEEAYHSLLWVIKPLHELDKGRLSTARASHKSHSLTTIYIQIQTLKYLSKEHFYVTLRMCVDRLCGLVVRVLDYRYRGPGFDSRALQKNVVGLERGPLSLVSTTEELLDRKVVAPV
jgi:hypothetical protein